MFVDKKIISILLPSAKYKLDQTTTDLLLNQLTNEVNEILSTLHDINLFPQAKRIPISEIRRVLSLRGFNICY